MDFREHQTQARKQTRKLVALYVVLLLFAGGVLGFLAGLQQVGQVYGWWGNPPMPELEKVAWTAVLMFGVMFSGVILLVSLFRMFLRSNGASVAKSLGGREIGGNGGQPKDELEKRYLNIVEEIRIASSLPMPRVFVLDQEDGVNAFAAGTKPENAAVAVTRGGLENLSRDELAGVVAHEFGHIANGDVKLNVRLAALVFGFTFLFLAARFFFHVGLSGSSRNAKGRLAYLGVAAALAIVGAITVFFGRVLQAAISRQREFLADASAVQFTRHPEGLLNAFKAIQSRHFTGLKADSASEMNHAFIFPAKGASLFDTHPPIEARMERLGHVVLENSGLSEA